MLKYLITLYLSNIPLYTIILFILTFITPFKLSLVLVILQIFPYFFSINGVMNNIKFVEWLFKKFDDQKIIFDHEKSKPTENNKIVYGCHPHGNYPILTSSFMMSKEFNKTVALMSSHTFYCPSVRFMCNLRGNMDSVCKKNYLKYIKNNSNVCLFPGGLHEMYMCEPDSDVIKISTKHVGFIKYAIEEEATLAPCFSFGENEIFYNALKIVEKLSYKYFGFTMILPILYNKNYIPYRNNNKTGFVVGQKIKLKKTDNVDEIKIKYYLELERIFNKYKDEYECAHKSLEFVDDCFIETKNSAISVIKKVFIKY